MSEAQVLLLQQQITMLTAKVQQLEDALSKLQTRYNGHQHVYFMSNTSGHQQASTWGGN